MAELYIENEITVNVSPERLWEVLTSADWTPKYMFGCRTVSDWQVGSKLEWRMVHEGQDMAVVTGNLKVIEPHKRLVYTVFDPFGGFEDVPENHLDVEYHLTPVAGGTHFRVRQGDFNTVAEGERRYKDSNADGLGWQPLLEQIKAVAEG
ncbi:MAG: SRPBCC domain-containing protein [Bacteroidia bacterium]